MIQIIFFWQLFPALHYIRWAVCLEKIGLQGASWVAPAGRFFLAHTTHRMPFQSGLETRSLEFKF